MSDPIPRLNAALEGRYRIERQLGEGGMATVYLARDLKHNRNVALKVLKPELAAVVGAERFLAEIETTANLQHPHILPLFDSGQADTFLFYVMPYVEGESLREKLNREKQLAVDEAVAMTRKVAGALAYAHHHGVVHRDIKPGNILLSEQGEPLIGDFGIALAVAEAGGGRLTETGLSLGTPHYMSPEQATGDQDVGPRSDVYGLGCVLYEMLAGEPPFSASTAQAILAKILTNDAPWITTVRRSVPANVAAALAVALEKLPADRFATATELAEALANPAFAVATRRSPTGSTARREIAPAAGDRRVIAAMALVAIVASGLAAWGWIRSVPAPEVAASAFRVALGDLELRALPNSGSRLAISRDGSQIVVADTRIGRAGLYLRRSDQREFRALPLSGGSISDPTLSPDGNWLAFFQNDMVRRVQITGGQILPVAEGFTPHWGADGRIVFRGADGLYLASPLSAEPTVQILADSSARHPFLLPDGKAVVFQQDTPDGPELELVEIDSREVRDLGVSGTDPTYVPTGHLVFGRTSQVLMAAPFDLRTYAVTAEPSTVLTDVIVYSDGATQFAVSENGRAIYGLSSGYTVGGGRRLVIAGLDGEETVLPISAPNFRVPRFSPSGRQITYDDGGSEVWIYDLDSGERRALTEEGDNDYPTAWSSDGRYVYYESSEATGVSSDPFRELADGSGEPERIFERPGNQFPLSVSGDGRLLLFVESTQERGLDLGFARIEGPEVSFVQFLRGDWNEYMGTLSPGGDRVAYVSEESGQPEVYVRSFPDGGDQRRVSRGGGSAPVWSHDGRALYFLAGASLLRAAVSSGGIGAADTVRAAEWAPSGAATPMTNWDLHPDGRSIVFVRGDSIGAPVFPVEMAVDWFLELRERVPN